MGPFCVVAALHLLVGCAVWFFLRLLMKFYVGNRAMCGRDISLVALCSPFIALSCLILLGGAVPSLCRKTGESRTRLVSELRGKARGLPSPRTTFVVLLEFFVESPSRLESSPLFLVH